MIIARLSGPGDLWFTLWVWPHQEELWDHFNGKDGKETFHNRRAIVFAHRRWGKDSVAAAAM